MALATRRFGSSETTAVGQSTEGAEDNSCVEAIVWIFPTEVEPPDAVGDGALAVPAPALTILGEERLTLGRDGECDVWLAGTEASRRHAEIARVGPISVIRDLGSRNGVFVNGVRVKEAPLSLGSILRLGDSIGVVIRTEVPADGLLFEEFAPGLFGGPVLRSAVALARRGAASALPIVLEGETGTGKELFARAIHAWSGRSGPFQAVNCAALPEALAEAELFGYRKGAFTGAERISLGHFRAADGGTLLLDEIVDMPLALQAKVLRVLERQEIVPLGETAPIAIDVRVIAAAQSSLSQAVAERRFRSDLLARLDGLCIRLAPLRERAPEIAWVFARLLARHAGGLTPKVDARLVEQLSLYDWPFNLRELDLVVRRLLALHGHEPLLRRSHLPAQLLAWPRRNEPALRLGSEPPPAERAPVLTQQERDARDLEALTLALRDSHGNVAKAAAAVSISRQRAYRLMGEHAEARLQELRAESLEARADADWSDRTLDPSLAK